ncbi:MAG: T9SS type A sorting domain-containing protein [Bacteroidetes bacterium]|nr:T9SS type A sorting domain-containing protein [Bacteroidota bacterium]
MKNPILIIMILLHSCFVFSQHTEHYESFKAGYGVYKSIHEPAHPLLDNYDITFYHIDLTATNSSTYIEGNVTVCARVQATELDTFVIELHNALNVDSILFNGAVISYDHLNNLVLIAPAQPLLQDEDIAVQIFYHGTPVDGLHHGAQYPYSYPYATYSLSEPFHAMEWFPCKQDLSDKADSVYVFITTDDNLMAGSNGILTDIVTLPDNKLRFEWRSFHPIVFYLISFSVSEYVEHNFYAHPSGCPDSVLVQNLVSCTDPGFLEDIDETASLIELFSGLYGIYPFHDEKYGHCQAPLPGGMEHQTMTTVGYFSFWLIAHELGHQWFGDYVTCATWQDIWINEGFASYTEYLAHQNLTSQTNADDWMLNAHDLAMTQPQGSVYIPIEDADDEARIFSYALSYKKGASLLHMIRFELDNDSLFFLTLHEFLQNHANDIATGDDFRESLEYVSGMDFTAFFDQWYYGQGFPTFDLLYWQEGSTLNFTVTQSTSSTETPLFITPVEYRINYSSGGDTIIRVMHDEQSEYYSIPVYGTVTGIEIDPDNWVLDGDGSVIVARPERALAETAFSIRPNPCRENVALDFKGYKGKKKVVITDAAGKNSKAFSTSDETIKINTSGYSQGIYFIKVISDEGCAVKKMVKQ